MEQISQPKKQLPLTPRDHDLLQLSIDAAQETYQLHGNYPVGAALTVGDRLLDVAGNRIKQSGSYLLHAEMQLLINHAPALYTAAKECLPIRLYSTLEPCLQCLGAAVLNRVDTIVYIQADPHGGAANLDLEGLGLVYRDRWPQIIYAPVSDRPLQLMRHFFHSEIAAGNTRWPAFMLQLLGEEGASERAEDRQDTLL